MRSSATRSARAAAHTAESAADTIDDRRHLDFRQCFLGRYGNALGKAEIVGFLCRAADKGVRFPFQNAGGTDYHVIERLGRGECHDGHAVLITQSDGGAGGLSRGVGHQGTLCAFAHVLCHAGCTAGDQHTAGDGAFAVVVQRTGSVVGGTTDQGDTAGDFNSAVGINAVTRGVDEQISAEDLDFRRGGGEGISAGASVPGGIAVVSASSVDAVVGCHNGDDAAGDADIGGFQSLVAFRNIEDAAGDLQRRIGVDGIIPGLDGDRSALEIDVPAGVDRIIRRIQQEGAAAQENVFSKSIRARARSLSSEEHSR